MLLDECCIFGAPTGVTEAAALSGRPLPKRTAPRHIPFSIDLCGRRLTFELACSDAPATLADMVGPCRVMSDRLCLAAIQVLGAEGTHVSCHRGCSHCCHYLVPLSAPEAFHIASEIRLMPESDRIPLLARNAEAIRRLAAGGLPPNAGKSGGPYCGQSLRDLSEWYCGLNLACPFLAEGQCTIYANRPLACREHWVTGLPSHCRPGTPEQAAVVALPVRFSEVLMEVAACMEGLEQSVLLPLAMPFAEENVPRVHRAWPGDLLVETFVRVVQERSRLAQQRAGRLLPVAS